MYLSEKILSPNGERGLDLENTIAHTNTPSPSFQFSENVSYVNQCFNGTFIQATPENRKMMQDAIETIKTEKAADFKKGLTTAFELFRAVAFFSTLSLLFVMSFYFIAVVISRPC